MTPRGQRRATVRSKLLEVDDFQVVVDVAIDRGCSKAKRKGETHINKQVLPQAPSPTMTSFRRISAMVTDGYLELKTVESVAVGRTGKRWPSSVDHSRKERKRRRDKMKRKLEDQVGLGKGGETRV